MVREQVAMVAIHTRAGAVPKTGFLKLRLHCSTSARCVKLRQNQRKSTEIVIDSSDFGCE
jgi:hypothetical protein